jgi:hypothetical protein
VSRWGVRTRLPDDSELVSTGARERSRSDDSRKPTQSRRQKGALVVRGVDAFGSRSFAIFVGLKRRRWEATRFDRVVREGGGGGTKSEDGERED